MISLFIIPPGDRPFDKDYFDINMSNLQNLRLILSRRSEAGD